MDELQAIAELTSLETVKAKRTVCKGKITRLRKLLDDFLTAELCNLQAHKVQKLKDDLTKEKRLLNALQRQYEYLLSSKESTPPDQIEKEVSAGEEASEALADDIYRTEELKITLTYYLEAQSIQRDYNLLIDTPDTTVGEFEKDCSRLQKRITAFLQQAASFHEPNISTVYETLGRYQTDISHRLNESRTKRRDRKERSDPDTSVSEPPPRPSRSTKLRLDLPDFSGHPLDWASLP